jgi:hypothetical protein
MFESIEPFAHRFHNLQVEIIEEIQASNEQHKFQADLHKYYDELNVEDYFMIHIRTKWCH